MSKLSDSEAEAAETQVWLAFGVKCGYLSREIGSELHKAYDDIIGKLVNMIRHPEDWHIPPPDLPLPPSPALPPRG